MTIPLHPPAHWFDHPGEIPTDKRVTITADGRAYGYVALWETCHVGMKGCQKPPKGSPTDYQYAHQGETVTAEGTLVRTANIGGGAGHAPLDHGAPPEFYENTSSQLMRVRYGEDEKGLWFAGAIWPDVDDLQRARLLASSVSGDWRWVGSWRETNDGGYDFAGACLVNIPGYPISSHGDITNQPGYMAQIAASLAGTSEVKFYTLDGVSTAEMDISVDLTGAGMCENGGGCCGGGGKAPIAADCGCGGGGHGGGDHMYSGNVISQESVDALNMKLDEALARLVAIAEALTQIEAQRLAQKVVQ